MEKLEFDPLLARENASSLFLPKQDLFGYVRSGNPVADVHFLSEDIDTHRPLFVGKKHDADETCPGGFTFNAGRVLFHMLIGDTGAGVDRILDHEIAIVQQKITEFRRRSPLFRCEDRQIKNGHDPAHPKGALLLA